MISSYRICVGVLGLTFAISSLSTAFVHPNSSYSSHVPRPVNVAPEEGSADIHVPETLRKKDVVAAISKRLDVSKAEADAVVTSVFDVISTVRLVMMTAVANWLHECEEFLI
jgi:hypothetical protein